jgi:hypothetical protein
MMKQCMWKNVENITKIKVNEVSLTLWTDEMGNKVKESDQVGNNKFRFDRTMLGRV